MIIETHDTTTLVLFTGNDHLEYRAGNFLTIDPHQFEALARWTQYLEDIKHKPVLVRRPPRGTHMVITGFAGAEFAHRGRVKENRTKE